MFNRIAICDAYYWYGVIHHTGQFSQEYKYLSRLTAIGYKPSHSVEHGRLDHDAAVVYARLVRQNQASGYNHCLCASCMETTLGVFCDACDAADCGLNQECKQS
jgi:hypothetical protein